MLTGYQVGWLAGWSQHFASRSVAEEGWRWKVLSGVFLHILTFWLRDNDAVPLYPPTTVPESTNLPLVSRIYEEIVKILQ